MIDTLFALPLDPGLILLLSFLLGALVSALIVFIFYRHRLASAQASYNHACDQLLAQEHYRAQEQQRFDEANQQSHKLQEQLHASLRDAGRWQSLAQERERSLGQMQEVLEQQKRVISEHFESLSARIFSEQGQKFSQTQEQSVKLLLAPMREQLQRFSQQVTDFQKSQISSQASLNNELKHLKDLNTHISKEAHDLTQALKGDKKLTGSWGELQLEKSLQAAGLSPDIHYHREKSYTRQDGKRLRPDFIVHLPDNKQLVIDSKVSLVAFEKAISADNEDDKMSALQWHIKALKKHIDDLSSKDYSALLGHSSPHFVFMYVGLEPAYIEALKHDSQLFDYGAQKNVVLVSHTTLMPILKTVASLWLRERSHSQAFALSEKAGEIYEQVATLAQRLQKLGRSLQTSSNFYNETVTALAGRQGLYGKIERFSELSKNLEPPAEVTAIDPDIEHERLATCISQESTPP